jgi:hypothetical protein
MINNVGNVDKIVRIVLGLGLLSLIFILKGDERWFGLIGVVLLATAGMNWCPAYAALGVKTNKGD